MHLAQVNAAVECLRAYIQGKSERENVRMTQVAKEQNRRGDKQKQTTSKRKEEKSVRSKRKKSN